MTLNTSKLSCACGATLESAFTTEINNWQELHKDCEKSDVSIPYDQFCMVMLKAGIELAQKVDRLVTVLEAKQQPYADKAAVSNDRINVDPATGDVSVGTVKQEQKRPQNCGTSYCSCIECVMDEQKQDEPVAHFGSAYVNENGVHVTTVLGPVEIPQDAKLYLKPQQRPWVGLTEEEVIDLWPSLIPHQHTYAFWQAAEAKLKQKNFNKE
jgi:hypothetical protein